MEEIPPKKGPFCEVVFRKKNKLSSEKTHTLWYQKATYS